MNILEFMQQKIEKATQRLDDCRGWDVSAQEERAARRELENLIALQDEMEEAGVFDAYTEDPEDFRLM